MRRRICDRANTAPVGIKECYVGLSMPASVIMQCQLMSADFRVLLLLSL